MIDYLIFNLIGYSICLLILGIVLGTVVTLICNEEAIKEDWYRKNIK